MTSMPDKSWLASLYEARRGFDADGVIGFVEPEFKSEPPGWLRQGYFFFKPAPPLPPTGTRLSAGTTATRSCPATPSARASSPSIRRSDARAARTPSSSSSSWHGAPGSSSAAKPSCARTISGGPSRLSRTFGSGTTFKGRTRSASRVCRARAKQGWSGLLKSVATTAVYGLMLRSCC